MIKKQSSKNTTTSKSLKKPIKKNSLSDEQDNLNAETEKMTLLVNKQNDFFLSGQTRSIEWRKKQLELLYNAISSHEQEIFDALKQDLSKSPFESYMSEIGLVLTEIKHMRNHISQRNNLSRSIRSDSHHVSMELSFYAHSKSPCRFNRRWKLYCNKTFSLQSCNISYNRENTKRNIPTRIYCSRTRRTHTKYRS